MAGTTYPRHAQSPFPRISLYKIPICHNTCIMPACAIPHLCTYMGLDRDMLDLLNNGIDPRIETQYLAVFAPDEKQLKEGSIKYDYTFISQKDLLCDGEQIQSCPLVFGDEPFTYDKNHLSLTSAKTMADKLKILKPNLLD